MFKKAFKILNKVISKTFEIAIWLLGFAMLIILATTFPTSSAVGIHRAIVNCDEGCYEELGLETEFPYRENLVVFVKRFAVRCSYFSLTGMQYDQLWQSDWMYDPPDFGDQDGIVKTDMNWPVPDADFLWGGLPIRSQRSEYEIGCPVNYIHNIPENEIFSGEPVNVPH